MAKSKKQIKKEQASMQSDALEMDNWIPSDGLLNAGTGTVGTVDSLDPDMGGMTYSFGDLGDLQQDNNKIMLQQRMKDLIIKE